MRAPFAPAFRRGLLAAIPVGAAMLLDLEVDSPAAGAISTGALLAGFVAFDARGRTRFRWQVLSAPAIGAAAALGALTGDSAVLAVATMTVFASIAGLAVAVSPRLSVAAMVAVLALLLAQGVSLAPDQAPDALVLGAAGVMLQALFSLAVGFNRPTEEHGDPGTALRNAGRAVRGSLDIRSPNLRHALRWGTALGVGTAAYHLLDLGDHGYWVPLTVLFVLKPTAGETIERVAMRAAGTVAGLAVATPLAVLLGERPVLNAIAIGLAAALSFALLAMEYALFTTAITAFVVLLAHALGQSAFDAAGQRALATLLGIAIATTAVFVWGNPRPARSRDRLASGGWVSGRPPMQEGR